MYLRPSRADAWADCHHRRCRSPAAFGSVGQAVGLRGPSTGRGTAAAAGDTDRPVFEPAPRPVFRSALGPLLDPALGRLAAPCIWSVAPNPVPSATCVAPLRPARAPGRKALADASQRVPSANRRDSRRTHLSVRRAATAARERKTVPSNPIAVSSAPIKLMGGSVQADVVSAIPSGEVVFWKGLLRR